MNTNSTTISNSARKSSGWLSITFVSCRVLQLIAAVIDLGFTANVLQDINSSVIPVPGQIIGTMVVTIFTICYCIISTIYFYGASFTGMAVMMLIDCLVFAGFLAIAIVMGKPLYEVYYYDGIPYYNSEGYDLNGFDFDSISQKAMLGLGIAGCVLFFISFFLCLALWGKRKGPKAASNIRYTNAKETIQV